MKQEQQTIVIDATDTVLGRLASYAAKQSLLGKKIIIVNCINAIVTGKRASILRNYKQLRQRGGSSLKGPHFPKSPERIMKRTIRGMLSYKQGRGQSAFKHIRCYNNIPPEYQSSEKILLREEKNTPTLTLNEISTEL